MLGSRRTTQRSRRIALGVRTAHVCARFLTAVLLMTTLVPMVVPSAYAGDKSRDDNREAAREMEREQRRQQREMEREAVQQAQEQQREQAKVEREQRREQDREQQRSQREQERSQRDQERAQRDQERAQREQERAQRDQEHAQREQERADREQSRSGVSTSSSSTTRPSTTTGGNGWQSGNQGNGSTAGQAGNSSGQSGNQGSGQPSSSGTALGQSSGGQGAAAGGQVTNSGGNSQGAGSGGSTTSGNTTTTPASTSPAPSEAAPVSTAPPATVAQWWRNVTEPKAAPAKREPAARNKPANAKAAARGAPAADLSFPAFERSEVLAVNATPQTLQRAAALGFTNKGATRLAAFKYSVTKLQAPANMSADVAETLLNEKVPDANVTVNRKYRLFKTATGDDAGGRELPAVSAGAGGSVSCGIDHCFGRDIVGWKPALKSCVSQGLKIGIIDTSVDLKHPAFARKKIVVEHLAAGGKPGPDWHGTGVTALLAGDSGSGTPGLIPDASFYVADVFYADTDRQPASDTLSMLRAFDWLEAKDVKLVNMSLSGPPDVLIRRAIERLSARGVVFVAAAGNEGPAAGPSYPAAYDKVIAVTAVGQNLKGYRYANRGAYIDVAAPGVAIWTALPGSKEGYHSGTSFAAPYVTAALAAIYAQLPANAPSEVLQHLQYRDLGAPGADPVYGQGLLIAPASCAGSEIAGAKPAPNAAAASSGLISTGAARTKVAPASGAVEVLPWLTNN